MCTSAKPLFAGLETWPRCWNAHHYCSSKQVNVGLTTVTTITACPLISWCIPDFCVFNGSGYVQTVFMPLQPLGTGRWNKCSAVAEMGDHLATIDIGQKLWSVPLLGGWVESPYGTIWPGLRPTFIPRGILIHPAIWPQWAWAKNWGGCAPFLGRGDWSPSSRMWPQLRPTSIPRGILISDHIVAERANRYIVAFHIAMSRYCTMCSDLDIMGGLYGYVLHAAWSALCWRTAIRADQCTAALTAVCETHWMRHVSRRRRARLICRMNTLTVHFGAWTLLQSVSIPT